MDTKICTYCNTIKPITCFSVDKHSPSGFTYKCKECHRAYNQLTRERRLRQGKRYLSNLTPEQMLAKKLRQKAWCEANKERNYQLQRCAEIII
jgi:hypothetical protein